MIIVEHTYCLIDAEKLVLKQGVTDDNNYDSSYYGHEKKEEAFFEIPLTPKYEEWEDEENGYHPYSREHELNRQH